MSEPVLLRSGGSIPVAGALADRLRVPVVLLGFTLPDDGMHGPNEKLDLPVFWRGVRTCIGFAAAVAEQNKRRS